MYFENNQKIHRELNEELTGMRKKNIELNDKIQKTKREILDLV